MKSTVEGSFNKADFQPFKIFLKNFQKSLDQFVFSFVLWMKGIKIPKMKRRLSK